MNREEAAGAQGKWESREQIAAKVDAALASETTRHFTAQSEVNQRRWAALFRHQAIEQQRFGDELSAQMGDVCRAAGATPPFSEATLQKGAAAVAQRRKRRVRRAVRNCTLIGAEHAGEGLNDEEWADVLANGLGGELSGGGGGGNKGKGSSSKNDQRASGGSGGGGGGGGNAGNAGGSGGGGGGEDEDEDEDDPSATLTLEDFAEEERRTWRVAQANMADTERFHIDCAFKLQLQRVDAEWAAHEDQMRMDYEAQKVSQAVVKC